MKHCHNCGGELINVDDIVNELEGGYIIVKGQRCLKCGEEILSEEEGQRMITLAKKMGMWGEQLKLYRKLSKSAGGTVLRIPSDIEQNMHLKGNEEVAISKLGRKKILVEIA